VKGWARHRLAALPSRSREKHGPSRHEIAEARAPRPIWLPQLHEPVTLVLASGETLPARVVERAVDALVVAVIVPTLRIRENQLRSLALEYTNPGGRVRLAGGNSAKMTAEGALVRIADPRLLEVIPARAHVRVEADCAISLQGADKGVIHTRTADVSAGGVQLSEPNIVHEDEEFAFELTLSPGSLPVTGDAEVARIYQGGRAGLYFSAMNPSDRWRLIRFTLECQEHEDFRHSAEGHAAAGSRPPGSDS
jgi:hypothetical protein